MTNELKNHVAESYKGIYTVHKYWSKKPPNVIRALIEQHSKEVDIVLDPFCGSGISIMEAVASNRKAVGVDINPSSIFIARQMLRDIDCEKLERAYKKLKKTCQDKINSYYKTEFQGEEKTCSHFIWDQNRLKEVWFKGPRNSNVKIKAKRHDINLANSFNYEDIEHPYPKMKMFENSRINLKKSDVVSELFSPRNLKALALINFEIGKVTDKAIQEMLMFCFTSCLGQASKMVFVLEKTIDENGGEKKKRTTKTVGSWVIGYWKPKEHFEINVWNCFEKKYKKIVKAKTEQSVDRIIPEEFQASELFGHDNGYAFVNKPSQEYLKTLPENSVDYIITDPPHGNRIPYLELSQMWNSWLGNDVDYSGEIIVSAAKEREKTQENYDLLLNDSFAQVYRILKPGKKFTLIFNSLDDRTWINIITTLNDIGFDLYSIETLNYSANSVVQDNRKSGLKTDFVLTYKKSNKVRKTIQLLNGEKGKAVLSEIIEKSNEKSKAETYEILNHMFFELLKKNQFFKLSQAMKLITQYDLN